MVSCLIPRREDQLLVKFSLVYNILKNGIFKFQV